MIFVQKGFTLIELLVVIGIIAVIAAILFPVFARAKEAAKGASCLSNVREIGMADQLYLEDSDGQFPETKDPCANPAVLDADGALNQPDYGSVFDILQPYVSRNSKKASSRIFICPSSQDPFGASCVANDPDVPDLTSYLVNAYFIFGMTESQVQDPSASIGFGERRSVAIDGQGAFCDYAYYPWFNPLNNQAPENDMASPTGAVATTLHNGQSNFGFVDGHVKSMPWSQTYSPPLINLHDPTLVH